MKWFKFDLQFFCKNRDTKYLLLFSNILPANLMYTNKLIFHGKKIKVGYYFCKNRIACVVFTTLPLLVDWSSFRRLLFSWFRRNWSSNEFALFEWRQQNSKNEGVSLICIFNFKSHSYNWSFAILFNVYFFNLIM